MSEQIKSEIFLTGIDASNPLAFLTALGALRSVTAIWPEHSHKLSWQIDGGAWRPIIHSENDLNQDQFCEELADWLATPPQAELFSEIGDNLTLSPKRFTDLARSSVSKANQQIDELLNLRCDVDYMAAFGSDATHQPHSKDRTQMQDTALRTMSGAGHQHFIKFMREIIAVTEANHVKSALFETWTYEDEGRGQNLRWDPIDDRRYAMRWKNPSADPSKTMRGANRLAIEALPLFSTAARGMMLETTGFRTIKRRGTFWSWPVWNRPASLNTIRSILTHPSLAIENDTDCNELLSRGVTAIFQSQRITVGKFRNFTPSRVRASI